MFRWLFRNWRWTTPPEPNQPKSTQYAALPWRRTSDAAVEVLLITSRETRRWVIPKGWPMKTLGPGPSAAQEAFEEAGVSGAIAALPLGAYQYGKRLRNGRVRDVRVEVFALEVRKEAEDWREKGQRELRWVTPTQAAEMVDEPELKALLARFGG